ncbi:uncharacterized protein LOC122372482 [Amphibalanus amphitrite]|uniref:uncharacterized protein LOC122372482 n=1 Tax=Amphibalanus amphitrite TaxID=1232801 RepID=UPI001C9277DB|nr:uncharacterized protein LOC122372482 [Amphibalanus amphitrite]
MDRGGRWHCSSLQHTKRSDISVMMTPVYQVRQCRREYGSGTADTRHPFTSRSPLNGPPSNSGISSDLTPGRKGSAHQREMAALLQHTTGTRHRSRITRLFAREELQNKEQ